MLRFIQICIAIVVTATTLCFLYTIAEAFRETKIIYIDRVSPAACPKPAVKTKVETIYEEVPVYVPQACAPLSTPTTTAQ